MQALFAAAPDSQEFLPDLMRSALEVVALDKMCVQSVIAEYCGLPPFRGNPDPREVSDLLLLCRTFEENIKAPYAARKSRSIMFPGSSGSMMMFGKLRTGSGSICHYCFVQGHSLT